MKPGIITVLAAMALMTLAGGCANQTTDPHQGGLFSYNPKAYEQRIKQRQGELDSLKQKNTQLERQQAELKAKQSASEKEQAALKQKLGELSSSTAALRRKISEATLATQAQQKERERILAELKWIQQQVAGAGQVIDPVKQKQELERLKKRKAELEKEFMALTQL